MTRSVWLAGPALLGTVLVGAACSGTTTGDQQSAAEVTTETLDPRLVPTTTVVYSGPAAELLPELGDAMSELSAQISEDGNADQATAARIAAIWAAAKPEIEADRPDLIESFETTVVWATYAVERNRPADADKAYSLLTGLIDNYTTG